VLSVSRRNQDVLVLERTPREVEAISAIVIHVRQSRTTSTRQSTQRISHSLVASVSAVLKLSLLLTRPTSQWASYRNESATA
jgi:hypothetical protein